MSSKLKRSNLESSLPPSSKSISLELPVYIFNIRRKKKNPRKSFSNNHFTN